MKQKKLQLHVLGFLLLIVVGGIYFIFSEAYDFVYPMSSNASVKEVGSF